jgi:hypothetical protein
MVMKIHPSVGPVSRVRHTFVRAGENAGYFISDLIFVQGIPMIVVEWLEAPEGEIPLETISLDRQHLRKIASLEEERFLQTEYFYELEVADPRQFD